MSAARGTRRPHPRRPRPRPRKPSRSRKRGGICLIWVLVIVPLTAYALWALALGAGNLIAFALAAAIGGTP